jgi:hypothetical protein
VLTPALAQLIQHASLELLRGYLVLSSRALAGVVRAQQLVQILRL